MLFQLIEHGKKLKPEQQSWRSCANQARKNKMFASFRAIVRAT
jgi:hypothetical protein